jgi:hypothetical protein
MKLAPLILANRFFAGNLNVLKVRNAEHAVSEYPHRCSAALPLGTGQADDKAVHPMGLLLTTLLTAIVAAVAFKYP